MYKIKITYYVETTPTTWHNETDIYTEKHLGEIEKTMETIIRNIDPNFVGKKIYAKILNAETIDGIVV